MDHDWDFDKGGRGRAVITGAALCLLLLSACQQGTKLDIALPPTTQLFGSLPWGLVNVTYTKGFVEPNVDSPVAVVLRGGDVVKILSHSPRQERLVAVVDYWYQVELDKRKFWIFGNLLNLYGLEMQARTASNIVRDKLFKAE